MVSGYPTFTSFPQVDDGWSTDPQVLGRHSIVDILTSNRYIDEKSDFSVKR